MSTQETLPEATDFSSEQAITIQPSGVAAYAGAADWPAAGEADSTESKGFGPEAVIHALRRNWLVIFATGIALAAVIFVAMLMLVKPKYTASAILLIAPAQPHTLSTQTADQTANVSGEFDIFRANQKALMTDRYVLTAAMRNQKLKNLATFQREDGKHNAVNWLKSTIQVELGKNSGIMDVSASLPDAQEAAVIVNTVVQAYMDQVVDFEKGKRRERLESLKRISTEKEEEVRRSRENLKRELESIGAGDDQTASVRGQMAVQIYAEYQRELQKMRFDRTTLQGRLEVATVLRTQVENSEQFRIPETDLVAVMEKNPLYRDLLPRKQMLESIVESGRKQVVTTAKASPMISRAIAELENTNKTVEAMKTQADKQVREAKAIELDREKFRLSKEIDIATEQITTFVKEVENKAHEADAVGKSSIAAQMQRGDLENVERILKGVAEERERLKVELDSQARVAIIGDQTAPAAVPEQESGAMFRYFFIALASLAGMCLPAIGIVMWDLRKQRINSPADVAKRLKLSVMGSLPFIPAHIMRRLGSTSRKSQIWKMRYTEAVDGVVARLLRSGDNDQTRVVLVTSAMSGEGKTWLATQLAMGLARAQRRTVLVDFDLRQPALDGALGLPLGPGICEALRGQGDINAMVQPTDTDCLSVVTAGNWNRQVLPALANGSVGTLLEQLRENFDFVVIDSSPLLPIVDTRLVCQHVDAVLLSVLRDVSEGAKVLAAEEMLEAFGVARVDAVVTGGEPVGNAKSLLYQAALVDEDHARLSEEQTQRADGSSHGAETAENN
jgi:polysaccharide biosynthesis transport protein